MMKSVALTESAVQRIDSRSTSGGGDTECDAEDFILVSSSPNAESATWEVSFDDDASYDRCDDVCSIFSAPQSLAIESNALDSFQKDFFSRGGADDSSNKTATEDFLLHDFSALGLSSGGFIDLPDDDLRELIASFSVDDDDDDDDIDGQLPPPFETSDSSVSGASNVHDSDDDDEAIAKLHPVAWGKAPVVTTLTGSPPDNDNNPASSDDGTDDDDLASILDEAMSRKVSIKPTRLCKKKRRKQLKLAKKAAAAAAAAAALTHFGGMVGTTPSSASGRGGASGGGKHPNGGKLNKRTAARSRKQIANIAVACATESYASYREECLRKSKK
jgi:hypothetical protein